MSGLRERVKAELANTEKRRASATATWGGHQATVQQWRRLTAERRLQSLRERARAARDEALNHHERYLRQFAENVRRVGGQVHFAADGAEAVQQVLAIVRQVGARLVVKAKSMVTEEIGLRQALTETGVEVVETDLGEYIMQLKGEPPSHITAPAIHLSEEHVAEVFRRSLGEEVPVDPQAMTALARRRLRSKFLSAEVGITGANFAVAETGSIVLVTNEGNADLTTSLPRVMIVVMGLEKLVPDWASLEPLITLLPRAGTGQNMTVYVTAITGPRRDGEVDGPEELHVVVLDGGRSRLLGSKYQDALRCIRCGGCLDACPVFRQVGGHAYGSTYSGPIGVVITPLLRGGEAWELPDLCSVCGLCTETCPVQVPLHRLILELRADRARGVPVPEAPEPADPAMPLPGFSEAEQWLFRLWAWAWSDPARYRASTWLASRLAMPAARDGYLAWFPGPLARWGQGRDFPAPAVKPFHARWAELQEEGDGDDPGRPVSPGPDRVGL
ncbi:MAG TPA: LutB/LldF family L-lactate oxidation iron-sulfur protein [Symbiobacteriaceae bacterium]